MSKFDSINHRVRFASSKLEEDPQSKSTLGNNGSHSLGWNNTSDILSTSPEQNYKMLAYPPTLEKSSKESVNQTPIQTSATSLDGVSSGLVSPEKKYTTSMLPANESYSSIVPEDVVIRRDSLNMSQQLDAITKRMFSVSL